MNEKEPIMRGASHVYAVDSHWLKSHSCYSIKSFLRGTGSLCGSLSHVESLFIGVNMKFKRIYAALNGLPIGTALRIIEELKKEK